MMRRKTRLVKIGHLSLSSEDPVVVQSMLNTPTMDTEACVEQAIRIIEAGGELVRITAQGVKEAENLKNIRVALRARGYDAPISADIHFNPEAALVAARYVEKVRINPGNFIDKRAVFEHVTYDDEAYAEELERLRKRFTEFLEVCREHHTAVRIGTNHGSLSDRIMSRYGNTPAGMVEATMEYLRVCQQTGLEEVVISLKSSDCKVMVDAVRLLVAQMTKEKMNYPLHLGVTEAGEGEDARIRSAIGIGTLLNEGIGDTIRVSLTEAPEAEIPVAKALIECSEPTFLFSRKVLEGSYTKPVVVADLSTVEVVNERVTAELGFTLGRVNDPVYGDLLVAGEKAPEMIYTDVLGPELTKLPPETVVIVPFENLEMACIYHRNSCPLLTVEQLTGKLPAHPDLCLFLHITQPEEVNLTLVELLKDKTNVILVLDFELHYSLYREQLNRLAEWQITNRILIKAGREYSDVLMIAAHVGGLFLDRLAYGLWITAPDFMEGVKLSRNILQSAGLRRYKTEFVSCPGCGRTLFDLQDAVAQVKAAFSHLANLKIAVMGCVVNGPGEMGDADYGYVGAGNGKVNLYKGRRMVKAAVPEQKAIDELRQLMVENGDWKECQL